MKTLNPPGHQGLPSPGRAPRQPDQPVSCHDIGVSWLVLWLGNHEGAESLPQLFLWRKDRA
jgi:hypothetical protein